MRRSRLAIPALGLALVLAACGGGAATGPGNPNATAAPGGTGAPAGTNAPDATGAPTPAPTEAGGNGGAFTGRITDAQDHNDLLALLPAELCGKQPGKYAFRGQSWFEDVDQAVLDELASYGKTVDDAFAAMEIVSDEFVCAAGIVRIKGLTPDQVKSIHDKMNDENVNEVTVDGRTVWQDQHSDTGITYYYLIDDAVVMASALDEAHAQEVLALLPKP